MQQAWIEQQVPLCGFCENGMMIKATELLEEQAESLCERDQGSLHNRGRISALMPLRSVFVAIVGGDAIRLHN